MSQRLRRSYVRLRGVTSRLREVTTRFVKVQSAENNGRFKKNTKFKIFTDTLTAKRAFFKTVSKKNVIKHENSLNLVLYHY